MRRARLLAVVLALAALVGAVGASQPLAVSPNVVISQVYGGGGNSGATYTHDFVELFNRGSTSTSLAGWSIQYASATGTGNFGANSGQLTELPNVSLAPGQYLLVQEASTAAVGLPLPTPDVTDATPIAMSGTAGKVALVNTSASLGCNGGSVPCSAAQLAQIVDLVGYGTANFFEGAAAAPTLSNTTAALRAANGCTETDSNASDFAAGTPTPRNTASPLNPCSGGVSVSVSDVSASEGDSGTTTFSFTVGLSGTAPTGGVTFDVATADGTATTADSDYTAKSLTGQSIAAGSSSYAFDVLVTGDTSIESDETFLVNVTNVTGATVSDGQGQGTILNDDSQCELAYTPVYSIQGSGSSAAVTGNVTTQGVVVGDFEGAAAASGFYLQDATGDGNAATSDGIFVFTGSANTVSTGQVVRVTGFARERFNQTALNGSNSNSSPVTSIVNCGTGSVAPTDVTMPFAALDSPERHEGMLVRFPQSLVISEYFNYDRFGELVLALPLAGETRPFTGTAIDEPGAAANARTAANFLRRITLDDAVSVQNPATLRHPNGAPFSLSNRFRGGDTVQNAIGVLGFDFSLYRIFPTGPADYTAVNTRPSSPANVGGSVRVAAMNTLNYFLTLDPLDDTTPDNPADNICGPLVNHDCRGADLSQPTELPRQRAKLLAALEGLDADVIGLNELENTTGVEPLADIVAGLNASLGAGTYAFVNTGTIGTDAIKVGLVYRPAEVMPVGTYQILDSTDDPRFIDTLNRPVLAQTFQEVATGRRFTVAVNHLKSKGSDCNAVGDPDSGDGQANCNLTRRNAARALVDWLATDPTGSGDSDFLIIGDLNSYAMEDPIDAIKAGPDDTPSTSDDYRNLIAQFQGAHAYSYVFDGQAGYLDHALASTHLASSVTGAADWHINADEPDVLDYDTSFKPAEQEALYEPNAYRSSDHDSVIVGLNLCEEVPPTLSVTLSPSVLWPPNHKYVTVQATITAADNSGAAPDVDLVSVTSSEPDNAPGGADGNTTDDADIVDDDTFRLRAERNETGTGRVYTITYRATDACGNSTTRTATVRVPIER